LFALVVRLIRARRQGERLGISGCLLTRGAYTLQQKLHGVMHAICNGEKRIGWNGFQAPGEFVRTYLPITSEVQRLEMVDASF
jgi:hypothetical protein